MARVERRSAIYGEGHGSAHTWRRLGTDQVGDDTYRKCTHYECAACGAKFGHRYGLIRNIFEAMENARVPVVCQPQLPSTGSND